MNSLKNNAGYRLASTTSTKKTSVYTRENTVTGPDYYKQTGSMLIESPRETAQLNRLNSDDLPPIELPSPPAENYSPLSKRFPPGLHSLSTPGQLSSMRETHRGLLSKREASTKTIDNDPKIIITPVAEEFDVLNSPGLSSRTSPFTPRSQSMAKQLSFFIKKKLGTGTELSSLDSRNKIEDPLRRKSFLVTRSKPQRNEGGRLLNIMARQAVSNRNTDVAKIFSTALEKLNVDALNRARKEQSRNKKKRIIKFFRKLKRNMWSLADPWKPDSLFVTLWKAFILCVILAQSVLSSYIVSFLPPEEANFHNQLFRWDFACDIIYILEILSLFQIEYYHHGELHRDRRDIVYNYLTTNFLLDLTTMLSMVGRFVPFSAFQNLMLLTIVRCYKIPTLITAIIDYFQFSREISSFIRVVRLSALICFLAHFCSCGLYALTKLEKGQNTWLVAAGLEGEPIEVIYVASLYWSVTTMSTTGFGDIAPKTVAERMFLVFIMILSSIIFGYILSTIGSLLLEISAYSSEAKEKIRVLTKYMTEKGLNKNVQSKIRKYLEFYLDRENTARIEGDFIMRMLSNNLQEEIVREVNAKIMCDSFIFSSNFRRKFLYIVSRDLVEKSFGPEETIFQMGEEGDCSIYFITSGKVDMCYERCAVSLQKLKKGASFGFTSFFSGRPRDCSAKSLEFTTVFQLKRHRFMEKLESSRSEKETFFMIKDSINLYENYKYLNLKCFSCGSELHITANCPEMHVIINHQVAIQNYIEEHEDFKRTFNRRYRSRFSALNNLEQLQEAASQAQITHQNEQCYELDLEEEFVAQGEGGSYSSVDEVLDRKIYDPKPLDFVADTVHMQYLDLTDAYRRQTSLGTMSQIPASKRSKQKFGETEMFMRNNYDPYFHNLNLDRVCNFEVYYPNNNIARLMVDFERVRFEKIVQMRLGTKAKHISPLLMRGFRMFERKNSLTHPKVPSPGQSPNTSPSNFKKRHSVAVSGLPRRESLRANPGDIVLYNSGNMGTSGPKPSKYKLDSGSNPNSNKTSPVSSPYLSVDKNRSKQDVETTPKKRFNPLEFAKRIGRSRERGLSIIKEDNTEKGEKGGTYNNLSIEERDAMLQVSKSIQSSKSNKSQNRHSLLQNINSNTGPLDGSIDFASFVNEIRGSATPSANTSVSKPKFAHQVHEEEISSKSSLEQEPPSGGGDIGDYSKLVQTFPDKLDSKPDKESLKPLKTKSTSKTDTGSKRPSVVEIKNKLFTMLVHERVKTEEESSHKLRSASEDKGKDVKKVLEKYQLPQIFKKMSGFDDD